MKRSLSRRTCAVTISRDPRLREQMGDEHENPWRCWRTCARWPIALARTLNSPARLHPGGPILRTIHAAVAHGWCARTFRRQESRPPRGNAGSPTQSDLLPRPRRQAVSPAQELDSPACSTRRRRRAAIHAKYLSRIFSFLYGRSITADLTLASYIPSEKSARSLER